MTIKLKPSAVLLLIFTISMALRIGLNVVRQMVLNHKPFLVAMEGTDDRISSDANYYIYGAKCFLNKKGVATMDTTIYPYRGSGGYKGLANRVREKKIDDKYFAHRTVPPLYILFLALCYFIGGFNVLAYFIPQLLLSSLTCLLIYLITEELFNNKVALFASLAVAFYPDLIFWTSFCRPETLFIFLLALGFLLFIKGDSHKNRYLTYLSAFIFGLAALTRITITPFLPFLLAWQAGFSSKNRQKNFKVPLIMTLIIFTVLFPWGLRNYILFGDFNVCSDEALILISSIENGEQYAGVALNRDYYLPSSLFFKVFVFIKNNFKVYLESCWSRFLLFWSPFTDIMKPFAKVYKGASWLIIVPAAFFGMIISRKSWKRGTGLIISFIIYYSLLHSMSMMHPNLVYRYPIQPFLCIFAGYMFYRFTAKEKSARAIIDNHINTDSKCLTSLQGVRLVKFYDDRYAGAYMDDWPKEKKQRIFKLIRELNLPEAGNALDFGCGNGEFTVILKQALPKWHIYGAEISQVAIATAQMRHPNCLFFLTSELRLMDKKFDFLFSHHVLEHVEDIENTWREIDGYLGKESLCLFILPCGNRGSFEYNLCQLRANGVETNFQNRFSFEEKSHLRRLSTVEMNGFAAKHRLGLVFDYYSYHYYGAIEWITLLNPLLILEMVNPLKARDVISTLKLAFIAVILLMIKVLRFPANTIDFKRLKLGKFKYYSLFCLLFVFYPFSKLLNAFLRHMANLEWKLDRDKKNGSEMYLCYKRI